MNHHKCGDEEHYLHYTGDCADPDPCTERWHIDKVRDRKAKRQGATIALIIAGIVAVAAVAFFLVAYGIVVFDENGKPIVIKDDNVKSTDKIVINAEKIVIDKKDRHNDD